jgi:hypothetical protein
MRLMAALIAGAIALTGFGAGSAAVPATFVAVPAAGAFSAQPAW